MSDFHPSRIFRLCTQAWNQATFVSGVDIVIRSGLAIYHAANTAAQQAPSTSGPAANAGNSAQNDVWQNSFLIPIGATIATVGLCGMASNALREKAETPRAFVGRTGSELGLALRPLSTKSAIGKHLSVLSYASPQRLPKPGHLLTTQEENMWAQNLFAAGLRVGLHAHQACQIGAQVCQKTLSNSLNAVVTGCGGVGLAAGALAIGQLYKPAHHHDDPRRVDAGRLRHEKSSRITSLLLTGGALVYSGATAIFARTEADPWHYDTWGGAVCMASGGVALAAGCMAALRAWVPFHEERNSLSPTPSVSVSAFNSSDDSLV